MSLQITPARNPTCKNRFFCLKGLNESVTTQDYFTMIALNNLFFISTKYTLKSNKIVFSKPYFYASSTGLFGL